MPDETLAQDSLKLALFSLEKLEKSVDKLAEKIDKMYKDNTKYEHQVTNLQDLYDKMTDKILKDITHINQSIAKLNAECSTIEKKIIKFDNQFLKCQELFDERYIHKAHFNILVASEIEKCADKKTDKVFKGAELVKSIIQIIMMISPYIIMIIGYKLFNN